MILVDFTLDHPILRETLDRVHGVELEWERSDPVDDGIRVLFWASGDDLDAFEAALEDDPTVTAPTRRATVEDERLYQLELRGAGRETSVYPVLADEGAVIEQLTATHEGWEFRVGFPERCSVDRFFDVCRDRDIPCRIHHVYEERTEEPGDAFGLSERQREVLLASLDLGYLDVPRGCSLEELGEHLGVSDSATSKSLRRATKALVRQTLARGRP